MATYKKWTAADVAATSKKSGYSDTFRWAPVDDFDVMANPLADGAAIGNDYLITSDHVFDATKGWIPWLSKFNKVKVTSEEKGDLGSLSTTHSCTLVLIGEEAPLWEMVQKMKNTPGVILLKTTECDDSKPYVQLGCDCNPVMVQNVQFDSKEKGEGLKETTITFQAVECKYFYSGVVTDIA